MEDRTAMLNMKLPVLVKNTIEKGQKSWLETNPLNSVELFDYWHVAQIVKHNTLLAVISETSMFQVYQITGALNGIYCFLAGPIRALLFHMHIVALVQSARIADFMISS